jgi:hypothetical protein
VPKSALFSSLLRVARDQAIAVQKNVSLATVADWRLEEAERKRVGGLSRRPPCTGEQGFPGRAP